MSYREFHFLEPVPDLVVGIDIGTSQSGFAVRTKKDGRIYMGSESSEFKQDKIPTSLLMEKDLKLKAFGYKAQRMYTEMLVAERDVHYYIESFESFPYESQQFCKKRLTLLDKERKVLNAYDVIKAVLKYLKDAAINVVERNYKFEIVISNIMWVLSVPLRTSDAVKLALSDAVSEIGILKDRLRIVSHEQAAITFCRESSKFRLGGNMPSQGRAIFADAGGQHITLTACDVNAFCEIKEIETVKIHGQGGNAVNKEIALFLKDIFGEQLWTAIKRNCPASFYKILKGIEKMKQKTTSKVKRAYIGIVLDNDILGFLDESNFDLTMLNKSVQYRRNILYDEKQRVLYFHRRLVETFYVSSVSNILDGLNLLVSKHDSHDMKVFVVGGFMESLHVQTLLQTGLPNVDVFIPNNPWIFSMQGAAMMGYLGRGVEGRITRFSYGIPFAMPFNAEQHPKELKQVYDGDEWCGKTFLKLIERGETVKVGDTFTLKVFSTAIDPDLQTSNIYTPLVISRLRNPKYCTKEQGCSVLGRVRWVTPVGGWPKLWRGEMELIVGDYEFTFSVINTTSGSVYTSKFEFC
ncbi:heat shock 70 kDa protein 12B-like [Mya arenaria]|uniref:heat shock 70 kDa protein 12B-like n=1 Tax=Mya arenaria TaxID=6604 RepID=UPI0022E09629|nr:heat shock 70 kDa protein 12B-like [Mya arenaria]